MTQKVSCQSRFFPVCEFLGSLFLVVAAVAPMILFLEVFNADLAVAVVADALAVGFVLMALIEIFGPICTSFFNPAVTLAMWFDHELSIVQVIKYISAQILGGLFGVVISHLMFFDASTSFLEFSTISRDGGTYLAEILGTFLLVLCIFSLVSQRSDRVSFIVGFLVAGMLLATSSTMFANPQVTIARMITGSAAGISFSDGIVFIGMQLFGAVLAVFVWKKWIKIDSS